MKVLFVINNYYAKGNGLSASARRTVDKLKEYGIDVKVLSGYNSESELQPEFSLKHFNIPIFNGLVKKQGYQFAKSDKEIIKQAVLWADVVHLEEPFIFLRVTYTSILPLEIRLVIYDLILSSKKIKYLGSID